MVAASNYLLLVRLKRIWPHKLQLPRNFHFRTQTFYPRHYTESALKQSLWLSLCFISIKFSLTTISWAVLRKTDYTGFIPAPLEYHSSPPLSSDPIPQPNYVLIKWP